MLGRVAAVAILMALPGVATAGSATGGEPPILDYLWVLVAISLVGFMQIGFLLLECGFVRSKTTINVAQKNIIDFMLAFGLYWVFGYMLMFGPSVGGWFGFGLDYVAVDRADSWEVLFFHFQAMFAGTAATIVSGAVSERMNFWGYVALAGIIGLVIYPVMGHWAWGGALIDGNPTLLGDLGFMDFAGATVVHSTGAWAALAAVLVIGPRIGRFRPDGTAVLIAGHNPVLSAAGALILMVGWLGFNGGSNLGIDFGISQIVTNTIIAGVFGGLACLLYGWAVDERVLRVDRALNGLIGGLVAVTAGCNVLGLQSAALVGLAGGLVAQYTNDLLLHRFKIDDVVGAIGVHGFAGAVGTILLALLAPAEALEAGSRGAQVLVQTAGVLACFVWAFGLTWLAMKALSSVISFRVDPEHEAMGLNTAEHGTTLGTGEVQQLLARMLERGDAKGELVRVEPGDEAGELAELFNMLLLRLNSDAILAERASAERLRGMTEQKRRDDLIVDRINALIARAAEGEFGDRVDGAGSSEALSAVCTGLNRLLGAVDEVTGDLKAAMDRLAAGDLSGGMATRGSGRFAAIADDYNQSVSRFRDGERRSADALGQLTGETRRTAGEAASALREIEDASRQALKIVTMIEEIADRTAMLSLNASIEASRAGVHGRAFAVVAGEVRALAARVREASTEIGAIMSRNSATVSAGTVAVENVRTTLDRIEGRLSSAGMAVEQRRAG
ncbi:MAG: methyl-accepting chemotaxis protein [Paracoccaceae bacterium]